MRRLLLLAAAMAACALGSATPAQAQYPGSWHGAYSYTPYGAPTALVVPPNARRHSDYNAGDPSVYSSRINGRFRRAPSTYQGGYQTGGLGTPYWPTDTNQFGVYYVREPHRY